MSDYWNGWACSDCIMLICNGEFPPDMSENERDAYLARIAAKMVGTLDVSPGRMLGDDGCECEECDDEHAAGCEFMEFSWTDCDYCGSTLGGSRHAITGWLMELRGSPRVPRV